MASNSSKSILSLTKQSISYGLGIFGRQLIIYLTIPLFTHYISQTEFGLISFAITIMAFFNTLTNVGLHGAIFRFYHDSDHPQMKRQVLGSSLIMLTLLASIPALGVLFFTNSIANSIVGSSSYKQVMQLAAILLIVDTLVNYGYILLRIQMRPLATSINNLVIVLTQMSSALILVHFYRADAVSYLTGLLIGEIIGLGLLAFCTRHIVSLEVSLGSMFQLLQYGLPLLPVGLAMWALNLADRALISAFLGLDQLAVYEVGYKMGMLVSLTATPFRAAWPSFAFSVMHKQDAQRIYRHVFTCLLSVNLFCMLGIIAFKKEILSMLAPTTYVASLSVVGWVALAQVFEASNQVLSIGPKISKKTVSLALVVIPAALVYLLLNVLLIPLFNIQGAAIATTIGYGLLAFGSYFAGQRSYPFSLDWKRLYKIVAAAICSYLLVIIVEQSNISGWEYYLGTGIAWLAFPPICLLFGILTLTQLRNLGCLLTEKFNQRKLQMHKV
ncbi:MAG: polysaccharide biosynthesis protein [Caldilinea sp. CFX5]|nr:polysaccharide biosynthesis protein [Caldilinea sp. CFX5]